MDFVLDASIALAWCFEDEMTAQSTHALLALRECTAFVPHVWPLEMANILVQAEKRQRISYVEMTQFINLVSTLQIEVDTETATKEFTAVLQLAYTEKLSAYDAAYLELAIRKGLPLASKDQALCKAACKRGIAMYE